MSGHLAPKNRRNRLIWAGKKQLLTVAEQIKRKLNKTQMRTGSLRDKRGLLGKLMKRGVYNRRTTQGMLPLLVLGESTCSELRKRERYEKTSFV